MVAAEAVGAGQGGGGRFVSSPFTSPPNPRQPPKSVIVEHTWHTDLVPRIATTPSDLLLRHSRKLFTIQYLLTLTP